MILVVNKSIKHLKSTNQTHKSNKINALSKKQHSNKKKMDSYFVKNTK